MVVSTIEDKYMVATHVIKEEIWLQILCLGIVLLHQSIRIDYDIQSVIFSAKNLTYHSKKKNIDVQYHFVKVMVGDKKALLEKVDTLKNVADSLTKSLRTKKFPWCRVTMGIAALDC